MAEGLTKYRARRPAVHDHEIDLLETASEFLRQSEALRQDFPQREASLRSVTDRFQDASARADELFATLDEKKRSADRAAEEAALTRRRVSEVLDELEVRHSSLLGAKAAADAARSEAETVRQGHHGILAEIDDARLDLSAFLEDLDLAKDDLKSLRAQSRPFAPAAPGEAPGDFPVPGAFAAVPVMYPAGPTVLGFLYDLITNAVTGSVQLTGGTMTGTLELDITGSWSGTAQAHSGAFGLILDKAKTLDTNPHSLIWQVGGFPTWEVGQDFDTNNTDNGGTGNSDFVLAFDHTANAGAGADVLRLSPAEKDSVATTPKGTKLHWGSDGIGSPRTNTHAWTVDAGAGGLGGFSLTIKSQNARDHITLVNAHATSKRAAIGLAGLWYLASDIGGVGTTEFVIRDKVNSKNRFYLEATSALAAKVGINTTGPVGNLHSATFSDAALYDAEQTAIAAGFSTIDNRTWNVQQILDASVVVNYMWMHGTLDAASTTGTRKSNSLTVAHGIECTNTQMSMISAPAGTNQVITPIQTFGDGTVGYFGATPVAQQANTADLKDTLCGLGFQVNGGASPLNLDNGALTCGALLAAAAGFTGAVGGNGVSFQVARATFTFAADADETLDTAHRQVILLHVQAGVISTTRTITIPGSAIGTFLVVVNSNANPVIVKLAGTGITVGAGRSRMLTSSGGVDIISLTPDNDFAA